MTERDLWNTSPDEGVSDEVGERVRAIIAAAESAAGAIRHEAEEQVQARRRSAEQERERYLQQARQEADRLLQERITRIQELSDGVIEGAEALLTRLEGAQEVKRQLEDMAHSLADAAERLMTERSFGYPTEATARAERVEEPEAEAPVVDADVVTDAEAVEEPEPERRFERQPEPEPRLRDVSEQPPEGNGRAAAPPARDDDDMLSARLVALQMAVAGGNRGDVEQHLRRAFDVEDPQRILDDVFGSGTDEHARVVGTDE